MTELAYWNRNSFQWALMKAHRVSFRSDGQLLKHGAASGTVLTSAPPRMRSKAFQTIAGGHSGVPGYALHLGLSPGFRDD